MHRRSLLVAAVWSAAVPPALGQRYHIEGVANPPGQINRLGDLRFANADFEAPASPGRIPGWSLLQHAGPPSYEMVIDSELRAGGQQSFRIRRTREEVYGMIEQRVLVASGLLDGRTVELSAMLRTRGVGPQGWLLMMQFLTAQNAHVGEFRSAPLTGDAEWQRVAVRAQVPKATRFVSVSAVLFDGGTGWVDDVAFAVDPRSGAAEPPTSAGS